MVDGGTDLIRWSRLGGWERLLVLAQKRSVQLSMTFLDGISVRAHQKAAGVASKGASRRSGVRLRRLSAAPTFRRGIGQSPMNVPVAGMVPRPA